MLTSHAFEFHNTYVDPARLLAVGTEHTEQNRGGSSLGVATLHGRHASNAPDSDSYEAFVTSLGQARSGPCSMPTEIRSHVYLSILAFHCPVATFPASPYLQVAPTHRKRAGQ